MRRWAEIKFLTAAIWLNRRHAWSQFHKWDHEQEFYVKKLYEDNMDRALERYADLYRRLCKVREK